MNAQPTAFEGKHFEVFTFAPASAFVLEPAYVGTDRQTADQVAAQIDGYLCLCDGDAPETFAQGILS